MTATFHVGDAIEVMGKLPEKSVDLILSSPPFLALRSYLPADHPDKPLEGGSQATPGEYVDWLIDVVEACARVLAPHGSLCFELGDTYSGSGGGGGDYLEGGWREGQQQFAGSAASMKESNAAHWRQKNPPKSEKFRPIPGRTRPDEQGVTDGGDRMLPFTTGRGWPLNKSLSLIPETFRWAMVYGHNPFTGRTTEPWRLRNVIRWVRPNPPVGALGDKFRPATSELMVFCKTKDRYFDLDAVREPWSESSMKTGGKTSAGHHTPVNWVKNLATKVDTHGGAPPLDWWNIPPSGYAGAHYAVWPPELLIKPIKAMCPETVCRTCGEPSRRVAEYDTYVMDGPPNNRRVRGLKEAPYPHSGQSTVGLVDSSGMNPRGQAYERILTNETFSDCGHDNWRPGLVLDCFGGSGTTAAVATGHGRDAILIDLDERNYDLALDRVGPLILERGLTPEA